MVTGSWWKKYRETRALCPGGLPSTGCGPLARRGSFPKSAPPWPREFRRALGSVVGGTVGYVGSDVTVSNSLGDMMTILNQPALEAWGRSVGEALADGRLPRPLVVTLRGPLGAGKSVLARAMARGAGVEAPMPSPTYNLLFTYQARRGLEVDHLDLYRLQDPDDVWELGWQELGEGDQLVMIEWPERAESLLPPDRWDVRLAFADAPSGGDALRTVSVERVGTAPALPPLAAPPGSS